MERDLYILIDTTEPIDNTYHLKHRIDAVNKEYLQLLDKYKDDTRNSTIVSAKSLTSTISFTQNHILYENLPIDSIPSLTPFQPTGMQPTPLFDEIIFAIYEIENKYKYEKKSEREIIVAIISQGFDDSHYYSSLDFVNKAIKEKEEEGWTFLFPLKKLTETNTGFDRIMSVLRKL